MNDSVDHWSWCKDSTKLMVELYCQRKDKFRDPKQRKKNLWEEIRQEMQEAGYIIKDAEAIDRKMRNMKKTFRTIKNNNKKTGRGRIMWEYFDTFEEMFAEDITINEPAMISKFFCSELEYPTITLKEQDSLDISLDETELSKSSKVKRARRNYQQNKKLLKLESERIDAIGKLTAKFEESNAIQEERNLLLKASNAIQKERNELLRKFLKQ